jgi:serine/threonine-protein kinase
MRDGARQVYVRDLSNDAARPIAGTDGAKALVFSPAGDEIAFWSAGAIRRVKIAGGPVTRVADADVLAGMSWGATGLVFSLGNLFVVDPSSPHLEVRPVTAVHDLVRHASPVLLPGDSAVLYTELDQQWTSGNERVMVQRLAPGSVPKLLLAQAADARYVPPGQLAFLRQGSLFVVPFDLNALEVHGEPVAVVKDIAQATAAWDSDDLTLQGQYAVAPNGSLAYVPGPSATYPDRELVSVDRNGRVSQIGAPAKGYRNRVDVSPDGKKLLVSVQSPAGVQLFAYDVGSGALTRIADALRGEVIVGSWSPANQIAVGVIANGKITASLVSPDSASPIVAVPGSDGYWPSSLASDGRLLGMKAGGLWIYRPEASGAPPENYLNSVGADRQLQPAWSPDGKWVAYTSNTTGRDEVYVRAYPNAGESIAISTRGGSSPAWNPNGRELFYVEPGEHGAPDRMMAAAFDAPGRASKGGRLFDVSDRLIMASSVFTPYAVARDGQHFYMVRDAPSTRQPITEIRLVLNWAVTWPRR